MKKRSVSILLALLLASSSLSLFSCSESEVNQDSGETSQSSGSAETSGTAAESVEEEAVDTRQLVADDLPEKTFGGAEFRVMTSVTDGGFTYMTEIVSDDLTGDACNDAVYNRNVGIEDRFDISIVCTEDAEPHNTVVSFATAGTDDAYLVGFKDYLAYAPITGKALLNWLDATYVDLDKPWHNSLANDDATINGQLYAICSDLSISAMTYTYAMYCNTDLAAQFQYSADDFYTLVKEGKWTIDKVIEISNGIYVDTNGNGTADKEDTYGFGYYPNNPADVWLTAFGGKVCQIGEDGSIDLTFMSDKTVAILEKLVDWHYNGTGFSMLTTSYEEETYFLNNKLVISPLRFSAAYSALREMDSTYIMLPYPKWDEAQESYYTMADDKFSVFGIPASVAHEMEMISIIYEALCAESYKQVYPAYYDQALKGKYSSDPTTAEMVDLIMEGRAFDFSVQFANSCFQRLFYMIRDMIKANDINLASKFKSLEKVTQKATDRVLGDAYSLD